MDGIFPDAEPLCFPGHFDEDQGQPLGLLGRKLGKDFVVPAASLSSFDTISIIVLIPLYDKVLVPLLGKLNIRITVLQRIGIGLVLASLAMVCAGLVERERLKLAGQGKFVAERDNSFSRIDGPPAVDMSVFWQTLQYAMVGASEVFASIGQLELFYDQAPDSMRSCCSALALLSAALGGYVAAGLIPLANLITKRTKGGEWIPSDLNGGHLDYFFYSIAVLNAINFVYFLLEARRFKYKDVPHNRKGSLEQGEGDQAYLVLAGEGGSAGEVPRAEKGGGVMIPPRRRRSSDLERTPIRSLMPMPDSPALPAPLR